MDIRNIAIIAHVDHGKTTLVDGLLKQAKTFRENEALMTKELIMDSNDQERERGITILAKNTSVFYKGTKINIVDTPGHADFGGEVERTLNMADAVLLLVDAKEGTMPQTKFVLKKALALNLKVLVVVNKIDKKEANIKHTLDKIYDLFLELSTHDHHLDFPILYAIGRDGKAWDTYPTDMEAAGDLTPIFDAILKYVPNAHSEEKILLPFKMLVASLDYDSFKGKYCIGKILEGSVTKNMPVNLLNPFNNTTKTATINGIYVLEGLKRQEVEKGVCGDIVLLTGITDGEIGETICDKSITVPLPTIKIEDPTLSVTINANTSPLMGKEGKYVTNRQLFERIQKELQVNVAMKFRINERGEYIISGRGELHLSVFLENIRREGFEFEVSKPVVITKIIDGVICEPFEELIIDVDNAFTNTAIAEVNKRRGTLLNQESITENTTRLTYEISTKNLFGLRSTLLNSTKGTANASSIFLEYRKVTKEIEKTRRGVLIASQSGKSTSYGLDIAQERGSLFIGVGDSVYEGMIVGINSRDNDIEVNVCKEKHMTNVRSAGTDDAIILTPPLAFTMEQLLAFIENDELLEITPHKLRLRKKLLSEVDRIRDNRSKRNN
ncbi:translational GTPase TypA [Patescibacteria group bacterium]|nr:translational GTPase TypA [Patescibacteria group bacterium]